MTQKSIKIWDFLLRKKNAIDIQDSKTYKRVTIKIKRNGISLRDNVIGTEIWTKKQFIIKQGQFLISKIDARNGAFGIVPEEVNGGIITWNFWTFDIDESIVDRDYFLSFISTNTFDEICEKTSSGTTNRKYLDEKKFLKFEIQVPETIEEQRITVNKYFEAQKKFSELKNLSEKNEKLIKSLKSSILQDAIQWKLVPQDPSDEPASMLIEKIQTEKSKLIAEWKLKKQKPLAPIKSNEIPYELPNGWEWVKLEDACISVSDWTHQTPHYTESWGIFLSAQNVKPFQFLPESHRFVSEKDFDDYNKVIKPEYEDVLVTRVGSNIWECAVIDKEIDFAIYVSLCLLKPARGFLNPYYLALWLNSPDGTSKCISNILWRWHSQWNLNLWLIRNFIFPLPPFQEQVRIVEKIDELMKSCELLDKQVKQAKERSEKLMESVLQGVFNW